MKSGSKKGFHKGCFGSDTRAQRKASLAAVGKARKYAVNYVARKSKVNTADKIDAKDQEAELQRVFKARVKIERKKIAKRDHQRRVQARTG